MTETTTNAQKTKDMIPTSMKLLLMISNTSALEKGTLPSHIFNYKGGSVGSSGTSAWRLDNYAQSIDPEAFSISVIDGEYCLTAKSDDVYVNDSKKANNSKPLKIGTTIRLKTDDNIRLARYVIQAKLVHHDADVVTYERDLLDILGEPETLLLSERVDEKALFAPAEAAAVELLTMENYEGVTDPLLVLGDPEHQEEDEELLAFYDELGLIPKDNLNISPAQGINYETARTDAHTIPTFVPKSPQQEAPPPLPKPPPPEPVKIDKPQKPREILDPLALLDRQQSQ